jgi:hypothetical protein
MTDLRWDYSPTAAQFRRPFIPLSASNYPAGKPPNLSNIDRFMEKSTITFYQLSAFG